MQTRKAVGESLATGPIMIGRRTHLYFEHEPFSPPDIQATDW